MWGGYTVTIKLLIQGVQLNLTIFLFSEKSMDQEGKEFGGKAGNKVMSEDEEEEKKK